MPLGPDVHYLSDVITKQQKTIDSLFWNAVDEDDWMMACRVERELKHLMKLLDEGHEYYTDF